MRTTLSLVSWNLHGVPFNSARRERFRRVASRVLDAEPDVVLFQEVWLHRDAEQMALDLGSGYEPVPTPAGKLPLRTSGLLSFVRRGGWTIRNSRLHRFTRKAPLWKFWEGDGLGRKGVQEIQLERERASVLLLNTHLQANYRWNSYELIRRPQLAQLCDLTKGLDERWPVIASGDLNTRPSEHLYHELLAHWHDLTAARRQLGGGGTHFHSNGAEGDWIDYILARRHDSWEVHAEEVGLIENTNPDVPYSDHQGLHVRLRMQPRGVASRRVQPLAELV
jgi:endonuclease/exonuclease/phosphatase family metal-dependent hydrolase